LTRFQRQFTGWTDATAGQTILNAADIHQLAGIGM